MALVANRRLIDDQENHAKSDPQHQKNYSAPKRTKQNGRQNSGVILAHAPSPSWTAGELDV
jgi:hypothetical protein